MTEHDNKDIQTALIQVKMLEDVLNNVGVYIFARNLYQAETEFVVLNNPRRGV